MPCRFRLLLAIARFRHTVSVMILSSRHFSRDLDRCTCAHGKQVWRAAAARLLTSPRLLLVVFSSRWKMTRTLRRISPPCSLVVSTRSGSVWRSLRYMPSCCSPMLLFSRRCIQPPVSTSPTPFPVWLIILVLIVSQCPDFSFADQVLCEQFLFALPGIRLIWADITDRGEIWESPNCSLLSSLLF